MKSRRYALVLKRLRACMTGKSAPGTISTRTSPGQCAGFFVTRGRACGYIPRLSCSGCVADHTRAETETDHLNSTN